MPNRPQVHRPLRRRLRIEWLLIALSASAIIALLVRYDGTGGFDHILYDRLSLAAQGEANKDVVIVAIDQQSLAKLGRWPFDRQRHAQLIDRLTRAGPAAIGLDVLLSDTGPPGEDAALAAALRRSGRTVLPVHFETPGEDGARYLAVGPAPELIAAAARLGHVVLQPDADGVVRRLDACFVTGERGRPPVPHMAVELLAIAGRPVRPGDCAPRMPRFTSPDSFATISYSAVLAGEVPDAVFAGRIVLVGATAAGMGDSYPVPGSTGSAMPGVEVIANFLTALETGHFIRSVPPGGVIAASILPVLLLMAGFLLWRPRIALLCSLAAVAGVVGVSLALVAAGWWLPPGPALVGIALVYPLWGWRRLAAIGDRMQRELDLLDSEPDLDPLPQPAMASADHVGRLGERLDDALDRLRRLRRFVADTLESLPDAVLVGDATGRLTLANHQLPQGGQVDDALARLVHPDDHGRLAKALAAGSDAPLVLRGAAPDQHLALRGAPLRGATGETQGHVHYLADVSALENARHARERAIQFLSHDMRAPQSAILAALEQAKDQGFDDASRARIAALARRTLRMADSFVDLARMEETPFAGEDVLLATLVGETADGLWPLARDRDVRFAIDGEECECFVLAEADSLMRAFANLLDNAVRHSPAGAVIEVSVGPLGEESVRVTIRDHGAGIDDHLLDRLFEPFARGSGEERGFGLGLAYVASVIARHGGTIRAENAAGGGACFTVTLPLAVEI